MSSHRRFLAAASLLAATLPVSVLASTSTWEFDSTHSSASFAVRHLMVSNVRGQFSNVKGTLVLDEKDITHSSVEATVDATTVDTRDAKRDGHLKSEDFFAVDKHPLMSFKSKKVSKAADGKLQVTGDLTLRGVTKEVTLDIEGPTAEIKDPWGKVRRGVTATTRINRQAFGVSWNKALDAGGVVVGDEVAITLEAELVKMPEPEPAQATR